MRPIKTALYIYEIVQEKKNSFAMIFKYVKLIDHTLLRVFVPGNVLPVEPGAVAHVFNPSTQEAKAVGISESLMSAWST